MLVHNRRLSLHCRLCARTRRKRRCWHRGAAEGALGGPHGRAFASALGSILAAQVTTDIQTALREARELLRERDQHLLHLLEPRRVCSGFLVAHSHRAAVCLLDGLQALVHAVRHDLQPAGLRVQVIPAVVVGYAQPYERRSGVLLLIVPLVVVAVPLRDQAADQHVGAADRERGEEPEQAARRRDLCHMQHVAEQAVQAQRPLHLPDARAVLGTDAGSRLEEGDAGAVVLDV
eukprot:617023-Rhodomonas_salina.1